MAEFEVKTSRDGNPTTSTRVVIITDECEFRISPDPQGDGIIINKFDPENGHETIFVSPKYGNEIKVS